VAGVAIRLGSAAAASTLTQPGSPFGTVAFGSVRGRVAYDTKPLRIGIRAGVADVRTRDARAPQTLGRPRDSSRDTAILSAALELIAEVGYERLSMDAIVCRARVSKATIYRRWPSKGALVAAAVRQRTATVVVPIDEGSLREDLLEVLRVMSANIGNHDMGLLTGIIAGMRTDPELADALRGAALSDKLGLTTSVFERAVARSEPLHAAANLLFHEIAPAVVIYRLLVLGESTDEAFLAHLVDDILLPVLTNPPARSPDDERP